VSLWLGAVALGLGFAAMCFGVYLSFRILNVPDLTIDGSFALGGATSATLVALGWGAWPSLLPALLLGAAAETRAIVSYEEAFEQELRAFHQNVTERLRPETDVEDSRRDLRVLTEMARKAF